MFFTGLFTGLMVGVAIGMVLMHHRLKKNNVEVPLTEDNLKKWIKTYNIKINSEYFFVMWIMNVIQTALLIVGLIVFAVLN